MVGQLVSVLVAHAVQLPEALVYAIVAGCEVLAEHEGVVMAGRRDVLRHHSCAQSARRAQLVPLVLHAPAGPGMHALRTLLSAPPSQHTLFCTPGERRPHVRQDAGMQTWRTRGAGLECCA